MDKIEITAPKGFEFTGEIRNPKQGDYILIPGEFGYEAFKFDEFLYTDTLVYPILKKKEKLIDGQSGRYVKIADLYGGDVTFPPEFAYVSFAQDVSSVTTHFMTLNKDIVPIFSACLTNNRFPYPVIQLHKKDCGK